MCLVPHIHLMRLPEHVDEFTDSDADPFADPRLELLLGPSDKSCHVTQDLVRQPGLGQVIARDHLREKL